MAPATPVLMWAAREDRRKLDTVEMLERLKLESEKFWKQSLDGAALEEVAVCSRELQDAIFNHRVSSPLVFDFLYKRRRSDLEAEMNAGAEHLVSEFAKREAGKAEI